MNLSILIKLSTNALLLAHMPCTYVNTSKHNYVVVRKWEYVWFIEILVMAFREEPSLSTSKDKNEKQNLRLKSEKNFIKTDKRGVVCWLEHAVSTLGFNVWGPPDIDVVLSSTSPMFTHFSMYCHQPLIEIKAHDLNICWKFLKVHLSLVFGIGAV